MPDKSKIKIVDDYYDIHRKVTNSLNSVKIYCDASLKDGVMSAGIYIIKNGSSECLSKVLPEGETQIIIGEIEAIQMALAYVEENFVKEAVIYTEINEIGQAHLYWVILNIRDIKKVPHEYKKIICNHRTFWSYFRYVYSKHPRLVLNNVDSSENPAHSVARKRVEDELNKVKLPAWKVKIILFCKKIEEIVEKI